MDIILDLADQLLLDCCWSRFFPIHPNTLKKPLGHHTTVSILSLSRTMDIHTQLNSSYSVFTGDDSSFSCDALSFQPQLDRAKDSVTHFISSHLNPHTGLDHQRCPSKFARDNFFRQSVSIFIITFIGILFLYFSLST